jgi:hypothetical protein
VIASRGNNHKSGTSCLWCCIAKEHFCRGKSIRKQTFNSAIHVLLQDPLLVCQGFNTFAHKYEGGIGSVRGTPVGRNAVEAEFCQARAKLMKYKLYLRLWGQYLIHYCRQLCFFVSSVVVRGMCSSPTWLRQKREIVFITER